MTSVYLVRHAHAHWTPSEQRPLSEEGRAAAAALARHLAPIPVSAIYCSPARRAMETIEPLAEARGIRPEIVPDLRERHLVVPPGLTFEAAVETAWREPEVGAGGSESNRAAAARGLRVLHRVLSGHEGQPVVLSTHGNLLALILNALDPAHGYETWYALTFPDVYRLAFENSTLSNVERL
jgi:2,3-bisphosphoglycerate-dependent phosphoglycerate mutase